MLRDIMKKVNVRCILDRRDVPLFGDTMRKHREFFNTIHLYGVSYIDLSFISSHKAATRSKWFRPDLRNLIRSAFGAAP